MKKVLVGIIILSILVLATGYWYWWQRTKNIEKEVLTQLRKELYFCEIVKSKIDFLSYTGEFYLICNGRPFYAEYKNGNVTYELNGWGFLNSQPEILNELKAKDCNFYDLKENNLIFFCNDRSVKMYYFSVSDFRLTKTNTSMLINYFKDLLPYNCRIEGDEGFKIDGENLIKIKMKCNDYETILVFNLNKMYFSLPTVVDEKLTNEEKANFSFQLIKVCKLEYLQVVGPYEVLAGLDCNLWKPHIIYNFENGISNFLFEKAKFEPLFPYFRRYTFPSLEIHEIKFIDGKEEDSNELGYYFGSNRIIVAKSIKRSNLISEVYLKNGGLK